MMSDDMDPICGRRIPFGWHTLSGCSHVCVKPKGHEKGCESMMYPNDDLGSSTSAELSFINRQLFIAASEKAAPQEKELEEYLKMKYKYPLD